MQEVEMGGQFGEINLARHPKAVLKQRPIKALPVKCHENGPFAQPIGNLQQYGMLLVMVAHKKLLNLDTAGLPPREPNQECIRAGTSSQASCLGVQKKPLLGIGGAPNRLLRALQSDGEQKTEYFRVGRAHFRGRMPLARDQILAVTVPANLSAKDCGEIISLVRAPLDGLQTADRPQRRNTGKPLLQIAAHATPT
jgi:hypothetical protein